MGFRLIGVVLEHLVHGLKGLFHVPGIGHLEYLVGSVILCQHRTGASQGHDQDQWSC